MPSKRQIAVALRYLKEKDPAPRVVAKGKGDVADKILALAREHGIPVHPDADLAEVLVQLDLGKVIPEELYQALAEILAYLYRMNQKAT